MHNNISIEICIILVIIVVRIRRFEYKRNKEGYNDEDKMNYRDKYYLDTELEYSLIILHEELEALSFIWSRSYIRYIK